MSLFVEERFNTEIRYGVSGGPLWSTDIVEVQSGIESANVNWSSPLGQWQLGQDIYNKKETDYLINFFNTRMGRAVGFRFKDWSDYKVQLYPGVGTDGVATIVSSTLLQLFRRYHSNTRFIDKAVLKPVAGTVVLYRDGVALSTASYTVDTTTGLVQVPSGTAGHIWAWTGEFDKPARFDTDKLDANFVGYRESDGESLFEVSGLTIKEIRLQVGSTFIAPVLAVGVTPVVGPTPAPGPGPAPAPAPAPGSSSPPPPAPPPSTTPSIGPYVVSLPTPGPDTTTTPTTTDTSGATTLNALLTGSSTIINAPAGIYIISAPVVIPTGKTLQAAAGVSVVLRAADGYTGNMVTMTSVTGSSLKNVTVDGNQPNRSSTEGLNTADAVMISGGSGNTVQNVKFLQTPSYAVWSFNSPGLNVKYNDFQDCWEPIRVDGNNVVSSGSIDGNKLTNTSGFKSIQHIEAINTKNIQIKNNTFVGAGLAAPTSHGADGTWGNSIYIFDSDGYLVENNTVYASYWSGIVSGQNGTNATIQYNYFEPGVGRTQAAWIEQTGSDTVTFTKNILKGGLSVGDTGGDHLTLTSNDITVPAGGTGIDCNSAFRHGTISGNHIKQKTLGHTDKGMYLWDKSTAGVAISVTSNFIEGFSEGISINNPGGTGTVYGLTITGNTFSSNTTNIAIPGTLTIDASCTIQSASAPSPAPAPPPPSGSVSYPFGSRITSYATGAILPTDTTSNFDNFIKSQYNYWKANILKSTATGIGSIPAGAYWPQFSDPSFATVSEGVGYAMLLAVTMAGYDSNAQTIFDGLLKMVRAFPSTAAAAFTPDSFYAMSWRVGADGSDQGGGWPALDGDLDIALALVMANYQWGTTGTSFNYATEATRQIAGCKVGLNSTGTIIASQSQHDNRTSDYMLGHFRAFKKFTGNTFWDLAVQRQLWIVNYLQTNSSPTTGLLPDWVSNADTTNPVPSLTNTHDGGANQYEAQYSWNACRDPWRLGADYVLSGDPVVKQYIERMETFFNADTGGVVTNIVSGYYLNGSHIVAVNPGGYADPAFQCPIMVGAMCDTSYQTWLNANWTYTKAHPTNGYYSTEIQLLCAIVASGNWWTP
jgi:uncharacterized protein (TIGR02217 family)